MSNHYLTNPPKHNIPEFIKNFYNKYVGNEYITQLAKWANGEFFACVKYYADKLDLKKWINIRKLSPVRLLFVYSNSFLDCGTNVP